MASKARNNKHRVEESNGSRNFFNTPAMKKHACKARVADSDDELLDAESGAVTAYKISELKTIFVAEGGGILLREREAIKVSRQATIANFILEEEVKSSTIPVLLNDDDDENC